MRDRSKLLSAEARLVPDVRILRRRGSQLHVMRLVVSEIPVHTIEAGMTGTMHRPNSAAAGVQNLHGHRTVRRGAQRKIELRASAAREPESRSRREHLNVGARGFLLERRDVVKDVKSASVLRHDDVVELFLDDDPAHGSGGQAGLKLLSMLAVVR